MGPGSYHGDDRVVGDHGEVGDGDASYAGSDWCMVINMVLILMVMTMLVMAMQMLVMKCLTRFADEIPTISRAANIQTHLVIKARLMIPITIITMKNAMSLIDQDYCD